MWRIAMMMMAIMSLLVPVVGAAAALPGVQPEMETAAYWLKKAEQPQRILLDASQIKAFNAQMIASEPDTLYNLTQYPDTLAREAIVGFITAAQWPEDTVYMKGQPVAAAYRLLLEERRNLDAVQRGPLAVGFTLRRSNVRTFPTRDGIFESSTDRNFDLFQETVIDPAEPVVVLHQSRNADWYYVQMYNYRGWIPADDVVLAPNRSVWQAYQQPADFLVVTANRLAIPVTRADGQRETVIFQMGAKLPLAGETADGYRIKLPVRAIDGQLTYYVTEVPKRSGVSKGYLPYTTATIVTQAFGMLNDVYGWGGLDNSVDCSSFIANIYRTVGINLPRNADQQEVAAGQAVPLADLPAAEKLARITSLRAGSALYMDGHVMLYLGDVAGRPYIIHSMASYGQKNPATGVVERQRRMAVSVSELSLTRASGKTFLASLTTAKPFLP